MNTIGKLVMLAAFAALTTGCGTLFASAGVEARPGDYHVNGYTSDPAGFLAVAQSGHTMQYNAETYRMAVMSGRAYPYAGGAAGDYWRYYGHVAPPVAAVPPAAASSVGTSTAVDPEARARADEARRRADDALRMQWLARCNGPDAASIPGCSR